MTIIEVLATCCLSYIAGFSSCVVLMLLGMLWLGRRR